MGVEKMKKVICLTLLIALIGLGFVFYFQSNNSDLGWPTEPQELVDHLNDWDKQELDAFERPEYYWKKMN